MEEIFYDIIYSEKCDNYEKTKCCYKNIDDAKADFIYMTQNEKELYNYVILRKILIIDNEETIDEIDCYYNE